jgi:hypothetical protein
VTEQEWLGCTEPMTLLKFLGRQASPRKLRLVNVACCRRLFDEIPVSIQDKKAVDVAELFADGKASPQELQDVQDIICTEWAAATVYPEVDFEAARHVAWSSMCDAPERDAYPPGSDEKVAASCSAGQAWERQAQVRFIRCIFGNPFRPVHTDPTWLAWSGGLVLELAQGVYDDRAFDRLIVLADALEEAGCLDAELLAHCREPGEHVRGCWVVDLLALKERGDSPCSPS